MTANTISLDLATWTPPEQAQPAPTHSGSVDGRGADWRGLSLGDLNLQGANLCRADLRGTDLSQCSMDGADLRLARYDTRTQVPQGFDLRSSGAVGPGAKLSGVFLNSTDLRGMDLRGAVMMGSYLSGSDLSGALLDGVRFVGSDLRYAFLRGALCRGSRFGGCQLDFADFRGCDLSDAGLDGAESLQGADFSQTIGLNEQRATLLTRPYAELDTWNPVTRQTTRSSLESLQHAA